MTRVALLLGALALNGLLAMAWGQSPGHAPATLHPVAPPLTRIAALGDAPLSPDATPPPPPSELLRRLTPLIAQSGTPAQRSLLERARAAEGKVAPLLPQSQSLRLAVEADAAALADALGPARVTAFVAKREWMSEQVGETRSWVLLSRDLMP